MRVTGSNGLPGIVKAKTQSRQFLGCMASDPHTLILQRASRASATRAGGLVSGVAAVSFSYQLTHPSDPRL